MSVLRTSALVLLLTTARAPASVIVYQATDVTPAGYTNIQFKAVTGTTQQVGTGNNHALWWNGAGQRVDLHPAGFSQSFGNAVSATRQGGTGYPFGSGTAHALLWNGSASSVVDLTPSPLTDSEVLAFSGTRQAGYSNNHAVLWDGTAQSKVDLHPSGFASSRLLAATDTYQGGWAIPTGSFFTHAMIWNGTATGVTDLHPLAGFTSSVITAVSGNRQAGYGSQSTSGTHALYWSGTAASAIDLNPPGFDSSQITGMNGTMEVGFGSGPSTGGTPSANKWHALLWDGSDSNAVDLHALLPADFTSSYANAIDAQGNIYGYGELGDHRRAIVWTVVPEPTALPLIVLGGMAMLRRCEKVSPLRAPECGRPIESEHREHRRGNSG